MYEYDSKVDVMSGFSPQSEMMKYIYMQIPISNWLDLISKFGEKRMTDENACDILIAAKEILDED